METEKKLCLECGKPLRGRADKKFCDDYCRNAYNNKIKSEDNTYIRQVNLLLKKNRRVLEELLGREEMIKYPKSKFTDKGFHFKYHTHQYVNKKGNIYYFCYEYGYLPLENDWYLIVKKKQDN